MDKEAQEKIDKLYTDIWFLIKDERQMIKDQVMRMLGYCKPLDRPEWREKIENALILMTEVRRAYIKGHIELEEFRLHWFSITDQILALIPDELPKDKPPLLSDNPYIYESEECRQHTAFEKGKRAQWDSDIKWMRVNN